MRANFRMGDPPGVLGKSRQSRATDRESEVWYAYR